MINRTNCNLKLFRLRTNSLSQKGLSLIAQFNFQRAVSVSTRKLASHLWDKKPECRMLTRHLRYNRNADDITQPSADCQQLNAVEQVCSSGFEERPREYACWKNSQVLFELFSEKFFVATKGLAITRDPLTRACVKGLQIRAKRKLYELVQFCRLLNQSSCPQAKSSF